MGLAGFLRQYSPEDEKKKLSTEEEQTILAKAVKSFIKAHDSKTGNQKRKTQWEESERYYDGEQWPQAIEDAWRADAENRNKSQVPPYANYYAWVIDKVKELIMESESKVMGKVKPGKTPEDARNVGDVNEVFDYFRMALKWNAERERACKGCEIAGTTGIYVGWDKAGGGVRKIAVPVEGKEEVYEPKIIAEGAPALEIIHPEQIAFATEAHSIKDSRTLVIKRKQTVENILAMFPDKAEEVKEYLKKQSQTKSTEKPVSLAGESKDPDLVGVTEEKMLLLYEVMIDIDPHSDFYTQGVHAFIVEDKVIHYETAWWDGNEKPIGFYVFAEGANPNNKNASAYGISKFWQLRPLQFYINLFIAFIVAAAQNDVTNTKAANMQLISEREIKRITNNPGVIVRCTGDVRAALANLPPSRVAVSISYALDKMMQLVEELSATYSPKFGFPAKTERKVGELQILGEQFLKMYKGSAKNCRSADVDTWRAIYNVLKHNVSEEGEVTYSMRDDKAESGWRQIVINRSLFEATDDKGGKTPIDYDFDIIQQDIPEPPALAEARINQQFQMGAYGDPRTDEAIFTWRMALKQIGRAPEDPLWELDQRIVDGITSWIETVGEDPKMNQSRPRLSRFYRLGIIARLLDKWYVEYEGELNDNQQLAYIDSRVRIEDLATERQIERQQQALEAQARLRGTAEAAGLLALPSPTQRVAGSQPRPPTPRGQG